MKCNACGREMQGLVARLKKHVDKGCVASTATADESHDSFGDSGSASDDEVIVLSDTQSGAHAGKRVGQ